MLVNLFQPVDFEHAVALLTLRFEQLGHLDAFREMSRSEAIGHSGGRTIRNLWGLWRDGSPLRDQMVAQFKLTHADDLSLLIFGACWDDAQGVPRQTEQDVQTCVEHWKTMGVPLEDYYLV